MGVEMIRDRQGKEHLVLSDEDFYNDDIMGDKFEDYEILQILSKKKYLKDYGFVSKVKSKFNSKIYAMKIIEPFYVDIGYEKNFKIEFEKLKNINEPNITKYYKYFYQDKCLYIIYEFMNNIDLNGFFRAYDSSKQPIEINTLWNIFMQCISGLKYIHDNNIIHKNINLFNIFMTEDKIIKLGDFRFEFLANNYNVIKNDPQEYKDQLARNKIYNSKTDIYAMGVVFQKLCSIPYDYPKEMTNIINLMLSDENNRPNTQYLYNLIMEEYIKNVAKITSIDSVFRCMISFMAFCQNIMQKQQIFGDVTKTPITYNFIKCLNNYMNNKTIKDNAIYLNNFRNLLYQNSQINNDIEINPNLVVEYLLEKLNKETGNDFKSPSYKIQPINFKENKEQSYQEFMKYFSENFVSIVSQYFIGFLKTKRICKQCREGLYSFGIFPFLEFDLERCGQNSNLENWFYTQNNHSFNIGTDHNFICQKCNCVREHYEFKQFYSLPQNFIISINRGEGFRNSYTFEFPMYLDLSGKVEKKDSYFTFNLVGIVKRIVNNKGEEYYISINLDPYKNIWNVSDRNNLTQIQNPFSYKEGMVMILFYSGLSSIGN